MAGGRNNDELKGAQRKVEVESFTSAGANEPGTRIDGALISAMLRRAIAEVRVDNRRNQFSENMRRASMIWKWISVECRS